MNNQTTNGQIKDATIDFQAWNYSLVTRTPIHMANGLLAVILAIEAEDGSGKSFNLKVQCQKTKLSYWVYRRLPAKPLISVRFTTIDVLA